jgi:hypothetical protein
MLCDCRRRRHEAVEQTMNCQQSLAPAGTAREKRKNYDKMAALVDQFEKHIRTIINGNKYIALVLIFIFNTLTFVVNSSIHTGTQ